MKELLDFIITGDRTYIAYAETKCGHVPFLLYPLLFDEDMTAKCDEFLTGLDRRRFQLFISNCGWHAIHSEEVAVCTSCDPIHLKCCECAAIAMSMDSDGQQHVWETTSTAANTAIVDYMVGARDLLGTFARLECANSLRNALSDALTLDEPSRKVAEVQLEVIEHSNNGQLWTSLSSPIAREMIDNRVKQRIQDGICTARQTDSEVDQDSHLLQFYYECLTCGIVRQRGCCEVCIRHCHAGHDIVRVPQFGFFECDCGCRGI